MVVFQELLHHKYIRYHHQTITIALTTLLSPPSNKINLTFLVSLLAELVYLSMVFKLSLACTASNGGIDNMLTWANFSDNSGRKVELGSFDGGEDAEHNSVSVAQISHI